MKKNPHTDVARNDLLLRGAIALAVTFVAMKIHAEVTIGFASLQGGVNQQSDGTPLDNSFTFELGTFANNFVPDSTNTDQWLSNWVPVQDASGVTLSGAVADYGTQTGFFGGTYQGYTSSVTLDHNNTPFTPGSQGYVWGFNTRTGEAEWVLMTNDPTQAGTDWLFPSVAGVTPTESWTVGTGHAILGAINQSGVSIQTASVGAPAVPEPSAGLFLICSTALLLGRRRRSWL